MNISYPTNSNKITKDKRVNLYFTASPLQNLVAKTILETFEKGSHNILLPYKQTAVANPNNIDSQEWDDYLFIPWPRFHPLPGPFGKLRRLQQNLASVSARIPTNCNEIIMHSAVFDTEATNYFISYLKRAHPHARFHARLLPDGIISTRRYPQSTFQIALKCIRKLRILIDPNLRYTCYKGDRCGSDAAFVNKIYILNGFPHEYDANKVIELPPLVERSSIPSTTKPRALVLGQPLAGNNLLTHSHMIKLADAIRHWLKNQGVSEIYYKGHPKDPNLELFHQDYILVDSTEPVEKHIASHFYSHIVGVRSTALITAVQLYKNETKVVSYGLDLVSFKNEAEKSSMIHTFKTLGIDILPYSPPPTSSMSPPQDQQTAKHT